MGWHDTYGYGGSGIGMALIMLLFWLPLIGLGIWLVARVTRSQPHANSATTVTQQYPVDSARGILDRRFASGEIAAEDYAQMRRVLDSGADK